MNKNYMEINGEDVILDYEKQMLAGVNIPSLLPVNIINNEGSDSICFITTGYKTISEFGITDIESLCKIIKSFIQALIVSEQYLLVGGKHFLDTDMVYYNADTGETKLVFGRANDINFNFGDVGVVMEYLDNLKKIINDKVQQHLIDQIILEIRKKNPEIKRIPVLVEEAERKWYCRNIIPELPFLNKSNSTEQVISG